MRFGTINEKNDQKNIWNEFILKNGGCFSQSLLWKEYQERLDRKTFLFYVDFSETKEKALMALAIKTDLPFGFSYLYFPRGPVFANTIKALEITEFLSFLIAGIRKFIDDKRSVFLRFEPDLVLNEENVKRLEEAGLVKTISKNPQATTILNLAEAEDVLLKSMKQKTRYNVFLAQKKGVTVGKNNISFEDFWKIMKQTSIRDSFRTHSKEYYRKFFDFSQKKNNNIGFKIYSARQGEDILATAIVSIFGKRAYYLHGASSENKKNYMAPHIMHWEIIKSLKKEGVEEYDFWGINPSNNKKESGYQKTFTGITKFKIGFGGVEKIYVGTYDCALNKILYFFYKVVRTAKRLMPA